MIAEDQKPERKGRKGLGKEREGTLFN